MYIMYLNLNSTYILKIYFTKRGTIKMCTEVLQKFLNFMERALNLLIAFCKLNIIYFKYIKVNITIIR